MIGVVPLGDDGRVGLPLADEAVVHADQDGGLDAIRIGGFKLGFWFANQGSEITFVVLIIIYVRLMNTLDKKYDVYED